MSRNIGEYDGYKIPSCDPSLSQEERKRLKREADEALKEAVARVKAAHK